MHVAVAGAFRLNKYRKILNEILSPSDATLTHKICIAALGDAISLRIFLFLFKLPAPATATYVLSDHLCIHYLT
jgi:hypothetical protein